MSFDNQPDGIVSEYIEKADAFVRKQGWSVGEKRDQLIYLTATYLFLAEGCITDSGEKPSYPFYVLHDQDTEARVQSISRQKVFGLFVQASKRNERVAVFKWSGPAECLRVYAAGGYTLEKDYGFTP